MKLRKVITAFALLGVLGSGSVQAQQYIKFVTGSAPGGGVDHVTQLLAQSMAPVLGRKIIVENRPGASYNIAADYVAKAPADGNTTLITFNVHPIAGALHPNLPFDPVNSFRAVGKIATTPYVLVANPKVPGSNLKEVIELAKKDGRSLSFASIGIGTPQHLMIERLKKQSGLDIVMAHYSNPSQGQIDVMGGRVDFTLSTIAFCESHVKAGRMKVLAVTSDERLPQFPDAITVKEAGYEGFVTDGWYAMLLPAGATDATVKSYSQALNQVLASDALRDKFKAAGLKATPSTPEVLSQQIRQEAVQWKKVITEQGIKAD